MTGEFVCLGPRCKCSRRRDECACIALRVLRGGYVYCRKCAERLTEIDDQNLPAPPGFTEAGA